jgi:hypothetical protein
MASTLQAPEHERHKLTHAHTYLQAVEDPVWVVGVVAQKEDVMIKVGIAIHVCVGVVHDRVQQLPVAMWVGWEGGRTGELESGMCGR